MIDLAQISTCFVCKDNKAGKYTNSNSLITYEGEPTTIFICYGCNAKEDGTKRMKVHEETVKVMGPVNARIKVPLDTDIDNNLDNHMDNGKSQTIDAILDLNGTEILVIEEALNDMLIGIKQMYQVKTLDSLTRTVWDNVKREQVWLLKERVIKVANSVRDKLNDRIIKPSAC